jgi:YVTN family beta-propeller protein
MRRNYLCLLVITSLSVFSTPAYSDVLSDQSKMVLVKTITGDISPKSVKSSGTGLVSAHNMMYRHSVTIYDSNSFELLQTVSDSVQLSKFGASKYSTLFKGAPVEGAFSPNGEYLYVTNYAMYGKGFSREGHDTCSPASNYDSSFLYRINLSNYDIDAVYPVGTVPKVVEVTPDNKYLLVSNWCSYDLSVISVATQKTVKTIRIGRYPRGIAVSNDSKYAYIAEMGGNRIHVIDLEDFSRSYIPIGSNPRAVVLSPDNSMMYVTMNSSGKVASWNLLTNKPGKSVATGKAARSLAISNDGSALFVVNFVSDTVSKVRTKDMKVLQTIKACNEPIGVAFDVPTQRTWVACYAGSIKVYDNQ